MSEAGFNVTHLYGLTETYGPAVVNDWKEDWDLLDGPQRAAKKARQGVRYHALEDLTVMDPETMQRVPADGETMGEVMFRGKPKNQGLIYQAILKQNVTVFERSHSSDSKPTKNPPIRWAYLGLH